MTKTLTKTRQPGELIPTGKAKYPLPKRRFGPILFHRLTNESGTTCQIGGVEKMKSRPSVFRMARAAVTAAAVCLVASYSIASAQNAATANDSAFKPPGA